MPRLLYKKASSIDTQNNCVVLFSREQCQGRSVRVAPGTSGHSHLSDVDFDNSLVSLKSCEGDWKKNLTQADSMNESKINRNRRRREVPFFSELMRRLGISKDVSGDDNDTDNDDKEDSQETDSTGKRNIFQTLFSFASKSNQP